MSETLDFTRRQFLWQLGGNRGLFGGLKVNTLLQRITVNPKILAGKPTIRGLRISVAQVLKALGNDIPVDDLLEDYPELEKEDIRACLQYAAGLMGEE